MDKKLKDTVLVARAQEKRYKSPFRDRRTSLFNVEAAKDSKVPHEYTRETFAPFNPKSDKIVG